MKILYIASSMIPSTSANSNHVMHMCEGLGNIKGASVSLLCFSGNSNIDNIYKYYNVSNNFAIFYTKVIKKIPINSIIHIFKTIKLIINLKPDVVIGRFTYGLYISSIFNKVSMIEFHAPIWEISKIDSFLLKRLLKKNNLYLIFISEKLKDIYLKKYSGIKNYCIFHDCASFNRKITNNQQKKISTIGYVGSLHEGKGAELVIKLAKYLPELTFYIIGGELSQIDDLRKKSSANVKYFGFIRQEELGKYYETMDLMLLPNQKKVYSYGKKIDIGSYTSPLKLFEYWSYCKPIIASKISVLEEVLIDGYNCILADPENLETWLDAINKAQNYDVRKVIAENGFNDIKHRYNWNNRAKTLIDMVAKSK